MPIKKAILMNMALPIWSALASTSAENEENGFILLGLMMMQRHFRINLLSRVHIQQMKMR